MGFRERRMYVVRVCKPEERLAAEVISGSDRHAPMGGGMSGQLQAAGGPDCSRARRHLAEV